MGLKSIFDLRQCAHKMTERPLFSCVMPIKGPRSYIDEALRSLYAQGLGNKLEIIVQDGDIEPDLGQSDALNKGFAKARGDWLFWLNADDILAPGALHKVAECIENNLQAEWIAGNQLLIDEKGVIIKCSAGNKWHYWMYSHSVPHVYGTSSFFKRDLLDRVGGLDASLEYCMDWDLWIRFMKAGASFERMPEYIWGQRQWAGSKTQRKLTNEEMQVHFVEIYRMAANNSFKITRMGAFLTRVVRLFEGCYFKELVDTNKYRGIPISEFRE